eukprot:1156713-Pelagomonas_calceolata.AAC.2
MRGRGSTQRLIKIVGLRAIPQAPACGQQLPLVCRLMLCSADRCWAMALFGRKADSADSAC